MNLGIFYSMLTQMLGQVTKENVMNDDMKAIADMVRKMAMVVDGLEQKTNRFEQRQQQAIEALQQTLAALRNDVNQLLHNAQHQVAQSVQQSVHTGLEQGTARYNQAVDATNAKLARGSQTFEETLHAFAQFAWRKMLTGYGAILGAILLAVLGGGLTLWVQWHWYDDAHERTAAAQIDADTAEAYRQVDMTSCGGRPCVKLDTKAQRWGSKGEYMLLDSSNKPKPSGVRR
jgi:hypothetical protein